MVTLPIEFTATRFPGYFFNTDTNKLYSLKIDGVLKELKITKPNSFNMLNAPAYRVSHKGHRRLLTMKYLKSLKPTDSQIPVKRYKIEDLPF